jgi:uncharacterized protein (DUF2147 family)
VRVRKEGSIRKGWNMPTSLRPILPALCLFLAQVAGAAAADIDGVWMRDDGNARVRVAPCGEKTCATNLWIRDTSKGEAPGDRLIMSVRRSSDTEFSGTAYDPKRGLTFSVDITLGNQAMKTRGCVLARLLCKTVNWAQVN